jgi:hypothetical protein
VTIKPVDCRMYVGQQRRTGTFTVHVDPKDTEACRALAERLAIDHGLPLDRAVMQLRVNGRWVGHRPA